MVIQNIARQPVAQWNVDGFNHYNDTYINDGIFKNNNSLSFKISDAGLQAL